MSNRIKDYKFPNLWDGCIHALRPSLDQRRGSGLILTDFSGYQNRGTLYGANHWTMDEGPAIMSPTVNDLIGVANVAPRIGTGPFTISMWAKFGSSVTPVLCGNSSYANYVQPSNGNWYFGSTFQYNWVPPVGKWFHVTVTRNAKGNIAFYTNGVNRAPSAPADNTSSLGSATWIWLGYGPTSGGWGANNSTKGDDFRLYNRALQPAEVLALARRRGAAYEVNISKKAYNFGPVSGGTGVTVIDTASVVTLTNPTATVSAGATVTDTVSVVTLVNTTATVTAGATVTDTVSVVTLVNTTAIVSVPTDISVTSDTIALGNTTATVAVGMVVPATADVVTVTNTAATVSAGATSADTASVITLVNTAVTINVGVIVTATVDVVVLANPAVNVVVTDAALVTASVISIVNTAVAVTTSVTVAATTSIVTLVNTTATVAAGATATATADVVTFTNTSVTVSVTTIAATTVDIVTLVNTSVAVSAGDVAIATVSVVTLVATAAVVSAGATTASTFDVVALTNPSATVSASAVVTGTHDVVNVTNPAVAVQLGVVVSPIHCSVIIFAPSIAQGKADAQVTVDELEIYSPEVIVIVVDSCYDATANALEDDMFTVDFLKPMSLSTVRSTHGANLKTGQYVPAQRVYTYDKTLTRQLSQRSNHAVKQLRLFMQSVQNDDVTTIDTIVELPKRSDIEPKIGDILTDGCSNTKYEVIALDTCTLRTRVRVGARRLV